MAGLFLTLALGLGCTPRAPPTAPTAPIPPPADRIALTIDDLPYQTRRGGRAGLADVAERAAVSDAMIAALQTRNVPATVFVNCGNLAEGENLPERWAKAGFQIGNHTHNHADVDGVGVDGWRAQISDCDARLRGTTAGPIRWFRFPYLRQGETASRRDEAAAVLAEAGYQNAPVTEASAEWLRRTLRRRIPVLIRVRCRTVETITGRAPAPSVLVRSLTTRYSAENLDRRGGVRSLRSL